MPPYFNNPYDQQVYDAGFKFVPQTKYLQNPFVIPQSDVEADTSSGLPAINMGGGGGGNPFTGGVTDLITDFSKITSDRQKRLNNPSDTFFGFKTMRDQQLTGPDAGFYDTIPQERTFAGSLQNFLTPQSADDIIAEGYTPRVNLGILQNLLPDRYGTLPRGDQAFIARNMGYTGPTVFGENTSGLSKDIFGVNTRSAFGNYAEAVDNQLDRLDNYFGGEKFDKKYGADTTLEFDEETGTFMFKGANAAAANKMNKMNLAKYNFYKKQAAQRDADRAAARAAIAPEDTRIISSGPVITGSGDGGGGNITTSSGDTFAPGDYTDVKGSLADPREKMDYYADGGIVDMLEIYD